MSNKLFFLTIIVSLLGVATDTAQSWTKTIGFEGGTIGTKAIGIDAFSEAGTDSLFSNAYSIEGNQSCHFHFRECESIWGKAHALFHYPADIQYGEEVWIRCYIYQKSPWSNGYCGPFTCGYWKFFRIARHKSDDSWRGYTSIIGQASGPFFMSNEACPVASIQQNVGAPYTLPEDSWECMEFYVKFHETDGIIRMWINGELKVEQTNFQTSYAGDYADFSYIYTTWNDKPPQDQDSYMDAIVVTTDTPSQQDTYGNYMIGPIDGSQPPGQASNPNPGSTTGISVDANLSWTAGSGAASHDVYFGSNFNDVNTAVRSAGDVNGNGQVDWDDVRVLGEQWLQDPVGLYPCADLNGDNDVNFVDFAVIGADWREEADAAFKGNQTATTFDPGTMDYSTPYYWRIDEVNAAGKTTGVVWSFTTEALVLPPGQAGNPNPLDSATDTGVGVDLSWTAGAGTTSHDVYFGTDSTPDASEFQGNQLIDANTYDPGTLNYALTYYWRIDQVNSAGTTAGNVWSFTTAAAGSSVIEEFGDAVDTNYPGTVEDTYTNAGNSTGNFSTDAILNTYTWPADTVANTTIIKWDVSAIPTDATVIDATLYLYQVSAAVDSFYDIGVHKIINVDPNITTCTWNTYDGTNSWTAGADGGQGDTAAAEDTQAVNSINNKYKIWTVTDMVQDWVTTPSSNYGMLVNSDDVASVDSHRYFASTDDVDTSVRPRLVIAYTSAE